MDSLTEAEDLALEVRDLVAGYGDERVLDGTSLTARRGEILAILGSSGCGKSTLLKNIVRLERPTEGIIRLLGYDMLPLEEEQLEDVLRKIGVMYQYSALLNSMTVGENVALPLEMHTGMTTGLRREVAETKLRQVGLSGAYEKYPRELSGGMRKRAAVARAIAMDPEILFCDEPSAGLDPVTSAGLDRLLKTLNETLGMTIVVVTHDLASIRRLADRIAFLHQGRVLHQGTLEDALATNIPEIALFFSPDEEIGKGSLPEDA